VKLTAKMMWCTGYRQLHVIYNDTIRGLNGAITAVKETETTYFLHTTNTPHGVTARIMKNAMQQNLNFQDQYYWSFGSLAGVKSSYVWAGCIAKAIG
jgi:hypothetical protein